MVDEHDKRAANEDRTAAERPTIAAESFDTGDEFVTLDTLGGAKRYELGGVLGEGGMGEVRVCTDHWIGRRVAMKVMRGEGRAASHEMRLRFFHEARVQGQTEHPSIVPVYDIGTDEAGAIYFTMRRVEGKTLTDVLHRLRSKDESFEREYSRHKLLTTFGNACLAIHFAHSRAVLHCDLKPANVMLGPFGELYVLDWGLATRAAERDPAASSEDSDARPSAGTPGYMAPEQIRGEALDARCDVFALGALLYEILTLEPMHAGKSRQDLVMATIQGDVVRPSVRAPDRDIPPELEAIWAKATTVGKSARYASAGDLYADLARYLEGDRDLLLRSTMSREHAMRAASLARRAREGGAESSSARSEALRTVGRALALDPDNPDALRTLVSLLTQPPDEAPAEALEDLYTTERSLDRSRGRGGLIGLLIVATVAPLAWLLQGIRDTQACLLFTVAAFATAALGVLRMQRPRHDGFAPTYLPIAVSILIAVFGICFHPTVLIATLALPFMVGYTLSMDSRRRFLPLVASSVALVLPALLEWLHVLAPSSVMQGELACMVPRMSDLPSQSSLVPVVANVMCMAGGCLYAARFREVLTETQLRACVGAWQLRQLLPSAARPPAP
jgi:serine/threonine protein kinase